MTNPVHLLSVAALLLVAFLIGAVIGSLARVLVLRRQVKPATEPAAPAETPAAAPLVAAPVIAPLPVAPTPVPPEPAQIPVPDFAATLIALADEKPPAGFLAPAGEAPAPVAPEKPEPVVEAMQPAHVAGETTSGINVPAPLHDVPIVAAEPAAAEHHTAEVIPFPSSATEPSSDRPDDIVVGGETVAIVDASDLEPTQPAAIAAEPEPEPAPPHAGEDNFVFVRPAKPARATPASAVKDAASDTIAIPALVPNAPVEAVLAAALPVPEVVPSAPVAEVPTVGEETPETVAEPAPEPVTPEPPAEEPAPEPASVIAAEAEPVDEDAAMRAIEGNWSPRRTPPKRAVRAVEAPEGANQAVAASARAVTAARRTAEAVVAEAKLEAGRPAGLDAPRDGRKDDLTHIIGVLPVIETALNKLGLYHFDQVGALTDENIGWIEGHLGVPGRIGRELWREQARELSAVLKPKRAAE